MKVRQELEVCELQMYLLPHRVVQHHGVGGLDVALDLVSLGEHHLGHVVGVGANLDSIKYNTNTNKYKYELFLAEETLKNLPTQIPFNVCVLF